MFDTKLYVCKAFFAIEFFTCNPPRCWRNRAVSGAKKRRNNRRIQLPFFSLFFSPSRLTNVPVAVADTKRWEISRGFFRSKSKTYRRQLTHRGVNRKFLHDLLLVLIQCVNLFSHAIDARFMLAFLENFTRMSHRISFCNDFATRILLPNFNKNLNKMQERNLKKS